MTLEVIILAAGQGTRMKSELPKVLHPICGVPMVELLLTQLDRALDDHPGSSFNIVVGHKRELVMTKVQALVAQKMLKMPVRFTVQDRQLGTGHAVRLALEMSNQSAQVAVFNGDLPIFSAATFASFIEAHIKQKSVSSLVSSILTDPSGYGRVVRQGKNLKGVVEHKDATAAVRRICEVNGGIYLFERKFLLSALLKLGTKNKSGEYYLPGVFDQARKEKRRTYAHLLADRTLILGVNNMKEAAEAESALHARVAESLMVDGVRLADGLSAKVGPQVVIGTGVVIGPGTIIEGNSTIGAGVTIGPYCHLSNVKIADGALLRMGVVAENAVIGSGASVGPMVHFRSGTVIGEKVKIGNFVEIKESSIGDQTSVAHLSYIGDAKIGARVNVGCGFVTCNYDGQTRDGRRKHQAIIGDDVFIGSDSQVVAPIEIASGTYIASGSTVTESVTELDSLVIARTRQVTKPGYAARYKKK